MLFQFPFSIQLLENRRVAEKLERHCLKENQNFTNP